MAIIDTCVELILLDGGTADFDLYTLYGKDGLEGTVLEASVDEGIAAKVREEEHAEKKLFEAALEEGFDLRLELGKLNGLYYQYRQLFSKCQAAPLDRAGSISLHGLPPGLYVAKIHIAYNTSLPTSTTTRAQVDEKGHAEIDTSWDYYHFRETTTQVVIAVQREREFVPSYQWQGLRGWHTVPLGLETKLPWRAWVMIRRVKMKSR